MALETVMAATRLAGGTLTSPETLERVECEEIVIEPGSASTSWTCTAWGNSSVRLEPLSSPEKQGGSMRLLTDRREAGRLLAEHLANYAGRDDVVVLGLPRGGVVGGVRSGKSAGRSTGHLLG